MLKGKGAESIQHALKSARACHDMSRSEDDNSWITPNSTPPLTICGGSEDEDSGRVRDTVFRLFSCYSTCPKEDDLGRKGSESDTAADEAP